MTLEEFLINEEGSVNEVYLDQAGKPTIGVGHLLTKDELSSGKIIIEIVMDIRKGLTNYQIQELFKYDLKKYVDTVDQAIRVPLNENQRTVLISLCYNIGRRAFLESTLLRKLNTGDYDSVPVELNKWIFSGGRKDRILIARRRRESKLWNA